MKKLIIILALTLVVTAGCTNQETTQENSLIDSNATETESQVDGTEEGDTSENTGEEGDSTEENTDEASNETSDEEEAIIPQAELDKALSKKNSIDIKASEAEVETISLEPESENWEPRVLKQYLENDEILKMTVTEPTDAGKMTGLTTFYYDEGELFFVESTFANYTFKGGKLIVWADEDYTVLDMSEEDLRRRQEVLVDYLVNYLEMFDIDEK